MKVAIMMERATRTGNIRSKPCRDYDAGGQIPVPKEHPQRRTLCLNGIGALALGQLFSQVCACQLVCSFVYLLQACDSMMCPYPVNKRQCMLLVDFPRCMRMNFAA